ncbi:hypothetical protein [Flavitalea sp.]|nr:hypothetical protein [Flavitalea sp.]
MSTGRFSDLLVPFGPVVIWQDDFDGVALNGYLEDWQKYVKKQIFNPSFHKSSAQIMHKNKCKTGFQKRLQNHKTWDIQGQAR